MTPEVALLKLSLSILELLYKKDVIDMYEYQHICSVASDPTKLLTELIDAIDSINRS